MERKYFLVNNYSHSAFDTGTLNNYRLRVSITQLFCVCLI